MSERLECRFCDYKSVSEKGRKQHEARSHDRRYKDADVLYELYHEKGMSQNEMADELGVADKTVADWMDKHDIETEDWEDSVSSPCAYYRTNSNGYETWMSWVNGEQKWLKVHRLLAIAENGFDEVCNRVVHHKNGIKWDNRPENIEVLDDSEHKSHHANEEQVWERLHTD